LKKSIQADISVRLTVRGNSMSQLLLDGVDVVTLHPCNPVELRPGEIILFRYKEKFLLHRIIQIANPESSNLSAKLSLKAYFFQSVKNRCLNRLRDLQIGDRFHIIYLETLLNQLNCEDFQDSEIINQINSAIAQLPDRMAEIFKLKYLKGKGIEEIALINSVSKNTVKTQLLRAKNKMRKILTETTSLHFFCKKN